MQMGGVFQIFHLACKVGNILQKKENLKSPEI